MTLFKITNVKYSFSRKGNILNNGAEIIDSREGWYASWKEALLSSPQGKEINMNDATTDSTGDIYYVLEYQDVDLTKEQDGNTLATVAKEAIHIKAL